MKITIQNKIVTVQSESHADAVTLFNLAMERKGASYLKTDTEKKVIHRRHHKTPAFFKERLATLAVGEPWTFPKAQWTGGHIYAASTLMGRKLSRKFSTKKGWGEITVTRKA